MKTLYLHMYTHILLIVFFVSMYAHNTMLLFIIVKGNCETYNFHLFLVSEKNPENVVIISL